MNRPVAWLDELPPGGPLVDVRGTPDAVGRLERELLAELGDAHELSGQVVSVLGHALPQDDVLVELLDGAALVHLTWKGATETVPWPSFVRILSREHLIQILDERY